jgi:hypothetical protein
MLNLYFEVYLSPFLVFSDINYKIPLDGVGSFVMNATTRP